MSVSIHRETEYSYFRVDVTRHKGQDHTISRLWGTSVERARDQRKGQRESERERETVRLEVYRLGNAERIRVEVYLARTLQTTECLLLSLLLISLCFVSL